MSRIGKQIVKIPAGTEVKISGDTLTMKGPKGELSKTFKMNIVSINLNGDEATFTPKGEEISTKALWGTYAAHFKNMLKGVSEGYEKKLVLEGVGFKSEVAGNTLKFALGFSHPVIMDIPAELKVTAEKNVITISGIDKESVGQFAAQVRDQKPPEPYKGKGIRYEGEYVRRKQGKKAV